MTPRELFLIVDEYNVRRERERKDAWTVAYLSASLQRARRLPPLEKLLEGVEPKRKQVEQTPEQMFAYVKRMHAAMRKEG